MDEKLIAALACELDDAETSRVPIRQFSVRHPEMTIEDGYRIGKRWVDDKISAGQTVFGHKIGLTSRAMQQSAGITEPDFGTLLNEMVFSEGGDIPRDRFITPKVEVELAFVLGKPLVGPGVTVFDVLQATDYVVPAVEIIDSRVEPLDRETGATRKVQDTIADNAANAGIIIGGRALCPDQLDLRWVSALLSRNAVIEETGVAAGVLNYPPKGIAWLANKLAHFEQSLAPGEVVLGGSFTRPVLAEAGDVFSADFGPLGALNFRFV